MCLIPYLCTISVNGAETALTKRKFNVEFMLPAAVASQISDNYELETIKAQAVICRSEFYRRKEGEEKRKMLQEICEKLQPTYYLFHLSSSVYEKGQTRDGEETLKSEEFNYLKSVDSSMDRDAEDYLGSTYVKKSQMPENLKISKRDQAGYVTELLADGRIIEGKGHGLGFSQYGGNELVKKGSTYTEILEIYFPGMKITNINETEN